jgi:hypothetical protein
MLVWFDTEALALPMDGPASEFKTRMRRGRPHALF